MSDKYHLDEHGDIVDQDGGVLYDACSLETLSQAARVRLAELHTQFPGMCWAYDEENPTRKCARDYLIDEGLMPRPSDFTTVPGMPVIWGG